MPSAKCRVLTTGPPGNCSFLFFLFDGFLNSEIRNVESPPCHEKCNVCIISVSSECRSTAWAALREGHKAPQFSPFSGAQEGRLCSTFRPVQVASLLLWRCFYGGAFTISFLPCIIMTLEFQVELLNWSSARYVCWVGEKHCYLYFRSQAVIQGSAQEF